jgi:Tfp pilus assembly protein PilN
MLSLLKKPSKGEEPGEPAWHPDFRNTQRLPDTKVVRTSFLLDGVALLVASILLIGVLIQAYELRQQKAEIQQWQEQVDRDKAPSAKAVALYKEFKAESSRIDQVNAFLNSRPILSETLLRLAETLPDYIAINQLRLDPASLHLRANVRGAPDQASGRASNYLALLKADAGFAGVFSEISLMSLNRDPQSGSMVVELNLKLKQEKK